MIFDTDMVGTESESVHHGFRRMWVVRCDGGGCWDDPVLVPKDDGVWQVVTPLLHHFPRCGRCRCYGSLAWSSYRINICSVYQL